MEELRSVYAVYECSRPMDRLVNLYLHEDKAEEVARKISERRHSDGAYVEEMHVDNRRPVSSTG